MPILTATAPVNGRFYFNRKIPHPIKLCVWCLYHQCGMGMSKLSQLTGKNKGLLHKWVKPYRRAQPKSSKPLFLRTYSQTQALNQRQTVTRKNLDFRLNLATALRITRQMFFVEKPRKTAAEWFKDKYANDPEFKERSKQKARERWHKNKHNPGYRAKRYEDRKRWVINNKDYVRNFASAYNRNRRTNDAGFRATQNLRARLKDIIHGKIGTQSSVLIGCNRAQLMAHLQSKFTQGMNWNNYGKWHVDHIIPCAAFDLTIKPQQLQCFHYTNLQPLWAMANMLKSDNVPIHQPELPMPICCT